MSFANENDNSERTMSHKERLLDEYKKLKAQGMTRKEICKAMCISSSTLRKWDAII